ncbi:MAG: CinA-like protein [Myxococcaceae bacterium]|nr:CinA-like protein [Myxococcaceae bacterium]
MRIETVCTGDELLTGLTIDTNSRFFQTRLLETLGLTVARNTVVGDVPDEIVEVLAQAAARSDAVLVCGGLGPTADDYTAECAARLARVPLEEHAGARAHLEERFRSRGHALTANNLRQAMVPQGAQVVINSLGSAPMFVLGVGRCTLFFVPGVPKEYVHLVESQVLPRLQALAGRTPYARLKLLKTVGLPESHLDAKVRPLFAQHPKVTFGFRTHAPENHLKLMAVGDDPAQAEAALAAAEAASRQVLGDYVFAEGDQTLAGAIGALLKSRGETVAVAESITGGRICAALTAESGASDWLIGGVVPYRESAKQHWLGVKAETLAAHTAVSAEVAAQMAEGVAAGLKADWGLAVTGYAGPTGGDARNPVGTIFLAVAKGEAPATVERHHYAFPNDRDRVQQFAAWTAMESLRRAIKGAAR